MRIVLIALALPLLIGAAQGIQVTVEGDGGSVTTRMNGDDSATIQGSMLIGEDGILSQVGGSGDVKLKQSASGGGQSASYEAQTFGGGNVASEIGATQDGVFGKMDYEGYEVLSPHEVGILAANPGIEMEKNTLTMSGKVLRVNGNPGDVTSPWYIDPAANFQIGLRGYDYNAGWQVISHETLKDSLIQCKDFANWASGKPLIDGLYETSTVSWGGMDGKNIVMWGSFSSAYAGVTSTYYNKYSRRVVESDTLLNSYYYPNFVSTNPNARANINRIEHHEFLHMLGMADATSYNMGNLVSQTVMGTAPAITWTDADLVRAKYNG